ncbi:nucleotidyltransferase domain-containing protein [Cellulomonas sp.]|uniref:nucleotidyltransferase domain-containing protein n=1 Tax=Cellulomonas sp. TaxID=40001 RepID=UPI00281116A1|nr:nucleotidyltransferase domain-containing protein [Cellulomonas sp.]
MNPVPPHVRRIAEDVLAARLPAADTVVVAGSSAAGTSTATSDVDLLVLGPDAMLPDGSGSAAFTDERDGRPVEVFAYTAAGYREWAGREVEDCRPVVLVMLATGVPVRTGPSCAGLRAWAADVLDAGPRVDRAALDTRRYHLTALVDDLADATDPAESAVLRATVVTSLAELLLLAHGRWLGYGKWLVRRLRAWDADVADALGAALAAGDTEQVLAVARPQLERLGGPLRAGFVR